MGRRWAEIRGRSREMVESEFGFCDFSVFVSLVLYSFLASSSSDDDVRLHEAN